MENKMQNPLGARPNAPDPINVMEIFLLFLDNIWVIILCGIIGFGAVYFYKEKTTVPIYTASSMIYMDNATKIVSISDLQVGVSLTDDFAIITKSRKVLKDVIDELDLNTSYDALVNSISISNPSGSHMLQISVTNTDPQLAADISNCIADHLRDRIAMVMNTNRPSIVEDAIMPVNPININSKNTAMKGGIVGAGLAAALIYLFYMLDGTIKTKEDVEKYLQLNTLASIPDSADIRETYSHRTRQKKKKNMKNLVKNKGASSAEQKPAEEKNVEEKPIEEKTTEREGIEQKPVEEKQDETD